MLKRCFLQVFVTLVLLTFAANVFGAVEIPEKKQTTLGMYVNSQEAYAMWKASPEKVAIIDCRTPQEYNYVGHAPMAYNIPSKFMTMEYDAKKKTYKTKANPNFVDEVKMHFKKNQTLLVICRSGSRSAAAANLLDKAGYKNVYNIYDGFEGDKVKIEDSYFKGQRLVNGWKNSGNPWTYAGDQALMYFPKK